MKTTSHDNNTATPDVSRSPAVQEAIDLIKRTLFGASKRDLASKYIVGAKVEEIRVSAANEKYGKKAVATIAREVGLTASCLYQYADVAHLWDKGTFDEVRVRAAKASLTFSHFVEIAHGDHAPHRATLLEEAIAGRLSVRAVRARRPRRQQEVTPPASGVKLADETPEEIDILDRLAADGPTDEIRKAIETELEELHRRDAELQRRVEELEAARATWTASPPAESCTDIGKAAE